MIKFSKNLEWFRPMVESVGDIVPLNKLLAIKSRRSPKHKIQRTFGLCKVVGNKFEIVIRPTTLTTKYVKPNTFKRSKSVKRDYGPMLDDIAHELAHLVHWEHNIEHLALTNQILARFIQWHIDNNVTIKDYYDFEF